MKDRLFDDVPKLFLVFWAISAVLSLAITGVIIWGVIELVQWLVAK